MRSLGSLFTLSALLAWAAPAAGAPLTLEEAYRQALQNNPQLQAAREGVAQAEAKVNKAWTYLGPTVNGQISHSWNNEVTAAFPYDDPRRPGFLSRPGLDGNCPLPPDAAALGTTMTTGPACFVKEPSFRDIVVRPAESTTLSLSGTQPLFTGQFIPGLQMAREGREIARASLAGAKEQVLYNVANLYFNTAAAERFVRLSAQSFSNLQDHLKTAEAKFAVGQIPRMGVLQAQIEVTRAQASLARARNDYQNAKLALGNLIGAQAPLELLSAEDLTATTYTAVYPADPTAEALKNRSDVAVSNSQVELARDGKNFAWLAYSPTLLLNGNIQHTDQPGSFGSEDSWTLMLMLNVPLIQGGGRIFDLQENYSKIRQAENMHQAKKLEVQLDVQSAFSKLQVTRENLAVASKQRELAQENFAITKISFENGLATSLDLIDANQTLLGAEINETREQLNERLDTLNYMRSLGLLLRTVQVSDTEE